MKRYKRLLKHFVVPHRGTAFRPHAFRHKTLSMYLAALIIIQIAFGITLYSGPEVMGDDTENLKTNIVTLTNIERTKTASGVLYESETLNIAAENKLDDMFEKGYWDHTGPNGETAWEFISETGYRYEVAGENLARGFASSKDVMSAWMESPTHKDNILNSRFQEIGLAVGTGQVKGATTTVIVQLFGRPKTAFASEQTENTSLDNEKQLLPEVSLENATLPSRTPYFMVWAMIFGLVILDGIMLRKLGLHTSPKHLYSFRVSLAMSVIMLVMLSIGISAIA